MSCERGAGSCPRTWRLARFSNIYSPKIYTNNEGEASIMKRSGWTVLEPEEETVSQNGSTNGATKETEEVEVLATETPVLVPVS